MSDEIDATPIGTNSKSLDKSKIQERAASSNAKNLTAADQDLAATFVPSATTAQGQQRVPNSTGSHDGASVQPPEGPVSAPPPKKTGTSQLGKYKLTKKLGQGGMGEVYLAEDINLGRKAAIKVLSKALAGNEDFVKRFYKEARAMARVNHENAVSVYDVDQERRIHYVAMEFVDGKSMQKWMDSLGKLSVGDALYVTLRCAEALQFAHGENLIHRDIKPDNIMLTSKGKVKVADFGLAKATDDDLSMTASGQGLGTPFYMAPEQARNAKHVDGRADIYALGITLYYFVTGKLPFGGNTALEVITAKEKGKYESPRKLNPQVPDRLDLIIAKMIERDPDRRCKDCSEVIGMLSGLGLENPSLSFIEASGRATQATSPKSTNIKSTAGPRPTQKPAELAPQRMASTGVPKTSAEDAENQERRSAAASQEVSDQWIVQYKSTQGKDTVARMTTAQIRMAVKTGNLDNKAKLKKNSSENFMPIGFFPEFEKAVEGRNIKEKAELKTVGMRSEYAKIARQYDRRGLMRWLNGLVSGTVGFVKLGIYLGVIFSVIFSVYLFRAQIWSLIGVGWDAFATFYNSFQKP